MPPISLNRRRFLGCSAAAGLALSQGRVAEAGAEATPVRLGLIGLGTRGTSLLRTLLEIPSSRIVALCDLEAKHTIRAQGIVEKARNSRPEGYRSPAQLLERSDLDAVVVALPCDLHASVNLAVIQAGKHLYAEKPLALTLQECDKLIAETRSETAPVVHIGFQRRSNPRYRAGVELLRQGDLGNLVSGHSAWLSSNGPMNGHNGWLSQRERSGDWMVEQAIHVWDVFNWIAGGPPIQASGRGRRDLFRAEQPQRDVTDHYSAELEWANGFHVSFTQSWIAPPDDRFTGVKLQVVAEAGGLDFSSGTITYRDRERPRQTLFPGNQPDTRLAMESFLDAIRAKLGPPSASTAPLPAPLTLQEARDATLTGLLVRKAVDEGRTITLDEIRQEGSTGQALS